MHGNTPLTHFHHPLTLTLTLTHFQSLSLSLSLILSHSLPLTLSQSHSHNLFLLLSLSLIFNHLHSHFQSLSHSHLYSLPISHSLTLSISHSLSISPLFSILTHTYSQSLPFSTLTNSNSHPFSTLTHTQFNSPTYSHSLLYSHSHSSLLSLSLQLTFTTNTTPTSYKHSKHITQSNPSHSNQLNLKHLQPHFIHTLNLFYNIQTTFKYNPKHFFELIHSLILSHLTLLKYLSPHTQPFSLHISFLLLNLLLLFLPTNLFHLIPFTFTIYPHFIIFHLTLHPITYFTLQLISLL